MNYYNEFDPYAADWLENLVAFGCIAPGDVDRRSIVDVQPNDLKGYTQCHFFAGIGGWSQALKLAGWPSDRPVWTGSCPCQPFSAAGQRKGAADERHLWPEFHRLIADNARPQGRLDGPGEGGCSNQRPAGPSSQPGFWSDYAIIQCADGKARRFEPGSFPLAHGVSNRVGRLRGYGNAIVPQVAAEFVGAYLDIA